MKILFMGTPGPAAECLSALIDAKEEIVAVITQPDRPKGRGLKLAQPPVKELALARKIPVFQPEKIKSSDAIELVRKIGPDLIVIVAYGKILPKEIIDTPKNGAINVHASLLPKYRGAAPVQWALMNGDMETGITIMKVAQELDSGDIILQEKVAIELIDNTSTLTRKLFTVGAVLLIKAIQQIKGGKSGAVKQDEKHVSLAPTLTKEAGIIDWKKSATHLFNQIRACNPWPIAYTIINGKMLKIFWADVMDSSSKRPGEVVEIIGDKGFIVGTSDKDILVREVQLEGGKRMSAKDFLAGHAIKVGEVLPN